MQTTGNVCFIEEFDRYYGEACDFMHRRRQEGVSLGISCACINSLLHFIEVFAGSGVQSAAGRACINIVVAVLQYSLQYHVCGLRNHCPFVLVKNFHGKQLCMY